MKLYIAALAAFIIGEKMSYHVLGVSAGSVDDPAESGDASAPSNSSMTESLRTYRAEIAAESENYLYQRIDTLENNLYYMIPPQTREGEYKEIVRSRLDQVRDVREYLWQFDRERLELDLLEKEGLLQDRLHDLFLTDPSQEKILKHLPQQDKRLREEVYEYLERVVEPVEHLLKDPRDETLNSLIQDLNLNGRDSQLYRGFYSHYAQDEFRRKMGLPLVSELD